MFLTTILKSPYKRSNIIRCDMCHFRQPPTGIQSWFAVIHSWICCWCQTQRPLEFVPQKDKCCWCCDFPGNNARHHRSFIPSIHSVLVAKFVIWFMIVDYWLFTHYIFSAVFIKLRKFFAHCLLIAELIKLRKFFTHYIFSAVFIKLRKFFAHC